MICGGTLKDGYAEKGPSGPATGVSWWQMARSLWLMYRRWPSRRGTKSKPGLPAAAASCCACCQSWVWTSMSPVTSTEAHRNTGQAGPLPGVGVGVGTGAAAVDFPGPGMWEPDTAGRGVCPSCSATRPQPASAAAANIAQTVARARTAAPPQLIPIAVIVGTAAGRHGHLGSLRRCAPYGRFTA